MALDNVLFPDEEDDKSNDSNKASDKGDAKPEPQSNINTDSNNNKKDSSTKKRLDGLKELLKADPIQLDTDAIQANPSDFPASQMAKYIDYTEEKKNHTEFATQVITNIIENYIKQKKLLNSPRLKDLKQKDIIKYSRLLLLVQISEENLIKLQESIDGGDMSKEMYDSVNKAQKEMRDNMEAEEKHLDKCEEYWSDYGASYGLENSEEKIVQESEVKQEDATKHTIIDMTKLTELIQNNVQKENERIQNLKNEENKNQD